jgi:hypothetical protein
MALLSVDEALRPMDRDRRLHTTIPRAHHRRTPATHHYAGLNTEGPRTRPFCIPNGRTDGQTLNTSVAFNPDSAVLVMIFYRPKSCITITILGHIETGVEFRYRILMCIDTFQIYPSVHP